MPAATSVDHVSCIRSPAGSIKATIAPMTNVEAGTIEAEISAIAAAITVAVYPAPNNFNR